MINKCLIHKILTRVIVLNDEYSVKGEGDYVRDNESETGIKK